MKPSLKTGCTAWAMVNTMSASDGCSQCNEHDLPPMLVVLWEQVQDIRTSAFMCPNVACEVTGVPASRTLFWSTSLATHDSTEVPNIVNLSVKLMELSVSESDVATSLSSSETESEMQDTSEAIAWLSWVFNTSKERRNAVYIMFIAEPEY